MCLLALAHSISSRCDSGTSVIFSRAIVSVSKAIVRIGYALAFIVVALGPCGLTERRVFAQTNPTITRPAIVGPMPAHRSGTAYLGAFLGNVTANRAKEIDMAGVHGVLVGKVVEESPAAKAGLKEGDVILTFRNQSIENREHFFRLLRETSPGSIVTLGILRDRVRQNVYVTLSERRGAWMDDHQRLFAEADVIREEGERLAQEAEAARQRGDGTLARDLTEQSTEMLKQAEERRVEVEKQLREGKLRDFPSPSRFNYSFAANRHLLGVSVLPLGEQLGSYFNVTSGLGVLVTEVKPVGLISRAGIRAGDCITALNGERINSAADLTRQLSRMMHNQSIQPAIQPGAEALEVSFTVVRDRREMTIKVNLGTL